VHGHDVSCPGRDENAIIKPDVAVSGGSGHRPGADSGIVRHPGAPVMPQAEIFMIGAQNSMDFNILIFISSNKMLNN
jgi:hypothetical protein